MDRKESDIVCRKGGGDLTWTPARPKKLNQMLTVKRLEKALVRVAYLIASGRQEYLPIFLRLEVELRVCKEKQDAVLRARRISEVFFE